MFTSLYVKVSEEELDDLVAVVNQGVKHILFMITDPYISESESTLIVKNCIMQYIERLYQSNHDSLALNNENLTWNLTIMIQAPITWVTNGDSGNDIFISFITEKINLSNENGNDDYIKFNLYIASDVSPDGDDHSPDYHAVIESYSTMANNKRKKDSSSSSSSSSQLKLGLTDVFNRKTLQHLFELHARNNESEKTNIHLCLPGNIDLPNLHCRNVEFIHSYGINTFYYLSSDIMLNNLDRETVPTLEPLLEKYDMCKNNMGVLLVKMLIQYGPIPCIDFALGKDYILNFMTFITHPFVYRTQQQAPTVCKKYTINKDDIDDLIVESEEIECKEDEEWMRANLHTKELRELTHKNTILDKKVEIAEKFY